MTQNGNISGAQFRDMVAAATNWLEKSSQDIDALNVFPVPDGDTGTNMLLTMRSAVEETYKYNDPNVSTVALAIAKGSLMGARGNSGVILSQIWRGVSIALKDKAAICASDWAAAMKQASETAYQGLNNPVEGTILTVLRDVATTSQQEVDKGITSVSELVEKGMNAAGESVANTPSLLPALREAGVVDAGGQGFYTILEGALHFLRGEIEDMQFRKSRVITGNIPTGNLSGQYVVDDEEAFGYCTEFLLKGENMDIDKIRERLKKKGVSLIVVGD
ncbi:MAG: DAK2 domain-containing protein, partial [Dehalococcoides mccartyi]